MNTHVLIVCNDGNPKAIESSLSLTAYLAAKGIKSKMLGSSALKGPSICEKIEQSLDRGVSLSVVLGGDGTILRAARVLRFSRIPILGIDFGHLGFLANPADDGVANLVERALNGGLETEYRANLRIDVVCEGEDDPFKGARDGKSFPSVVSPSRSQFALNEVTMTRSVSSRIIDFSLDISGNRIANMRGDGVVVSTATGSTAYSLSVGGPLAPPNFDGMIAMPIAPHTLCARPLLTGPDDVVCAALASEEANGLALLLIDGDMLSFNRPVRRMYVRRGDEPTVFLRLEGENFYKQVSKTFFCR